MPRTPWEKQPQSDVFLLEADRVALARRDQEVLIAGRRLHRDEVVVVADVDGLDAGLARIRVKQKHVSDCALIPARHEDELARVVEFIDCDDGLDLLILLEVFEQVDDQASLVARPPAGFPTP